MNPLQKTDWKRLHFKLLLCLCFICFSGCLTLSNRGPVPEKVSQCRDLSQQGITYVQQGNWAAAERLFSEALKMCPENCDAHSQLAEVYWHQGEQQKAIRQLLQARKHAQGDVTIDLRLSEMNFALGRTKEAMNWIDEALDVQPDYAEAWAMRGKILASQNQAKQAISNYQRDAWLSARQSGFDDRTDEFVSHHTTC